MKRNETILSGSKDTNYILESSRRRVQVTSRIPPHQMMVVGILISVLCFSLGQCHLKRFTCKSL